MSAVIVLNNSFQSLVTQIHVSNITFNVCVLNQNHQLRSFLFRVRLPHPFHSPFESHALISGSKW